MSLRDTFPTAEDGWSTRPTEVLPVAEYEHWLWLFVVAALLLDVATTTYGIEQGLSEANPVARRLFARFDPLGAMLVLKGTVVALGIVAWVLLPQRYRGFVPLGVALPWAFAGLFNLAMLARFTV